MEFKGKYGVPASPDEVWDALHDPGILAAAIPGCEAVEKISATEFKARAVVMAGVLTLRGEKKAERNGEGRYSTERYYGAFERQIPLEGVEEDKAEASFSNGVLTVSLPKSEKAREGVKRIAINTH